MWPFQGVENRAPVGALSRGPFGTVPGLGWPVSYLGFAYFIAMLMAWAASWPGVSTLITWIGRLGALMSLGWFIVMLVEWKLCPYCITAHLANFGFWITLEFSTRREPSTMPAFLNLACSWIVVTVLLVVGQNQIDHQTEMANSLVAKQNMQDIIASSLETNAAAQDVVEEPEIDTENIAFMGERGVVNDPSDFTGRYLYGPENAPVRIVMLSDYQCPDCLRYEKQMAKILKERNDVSMSVRHFPFNADCNPHINRTQHFNACWAARFVETAGILGGNESFWEAHELMFEREGRFTPEDFPILVNALGFDPQSFQKIMLGPAVNALIADDVELGGKLGVFYTPMIFVNGVELKWYSIPTNLSNTINRCCPGHCPGAAQGRTCSTTDQGREVRAGLA